MKVVTAGSAYMDIDAYAGCIAEAELLNLEGEEAYAASSAPLNESIPGSLRMLGVGLEAYNPTANDEFILIDVSKEEFFDPIVKNGTVVEVIDHHPGQEEYWAERIGDKADIEFIGAACTQIFERWKTQDKLSEMKPEIARLLAAGILDNTLNFNAGVTTDRDKHAYAALTKIGGLSEDFPAQYFTECQESIDRDFATALRNDTKIMNETSKLPLVLGQITVWDGRTYARDKFSTIENVLMERGEDWAMNLISINDGKSYFISASESGQAKLKAMLGAEFNDGVAEADRLWLRKELLKLALEK